MQQQIKLIGAKHYLTLLFMLFFSLFSQAKGNHDTILVSELADTYDQLILIADKDQNRKLSRKELVSSYYSPDTPAHLYKVISTILENYSTLSGNEFGSISNTILITAGLPPEEAEVSNGKDDDPYWNEFIEIAGYSEYNETVRQLFPKGINSISANNVFQNRFPDCGLISVIVSLARNEQGKRSILKRFDMLGDNTIEITFSFKVFSLEDSNVSPIVAVDLNKLKQESRHAKSSDGGLWPAAIERAFALYTLPMKNTYTVAEDTVENIKSSIIKYGDMWKLHGPNTGLTAEVLFSGATISIALSPETEQKIQKILMKKIKNATPLILVVDGGKKHYPLDIGAHVYSIIDYDYESQVVTLRDPNGFYEPGYTTQHEYLPIDDKLDGTFKMTLQEFTHSFAETTLVYGELN